MRFRAGAAPGCCNRHAHCRWGCGWAPWGALTRVTRTADIAASYVKFVEGAGAQAVPIQFYESDANITAMVKGVNGVLFPGGGTSLAASGKFFQSLHTAYNAVLDANAGGEHVPLWATCLGFEALMLLASGLNYSVLHAGFDSWNLPLPLDFAVDPKRTELFQGAPDSLLAALEKENVTMNNHHSGINVDAFRGNANLTRTLRMVSSNAGRQGKMFVSTVEGVHLPIFGVQWHPEKNAYEWTPRENIPHSEAAVSVMQWVADRFVQHARRNDRGFGAAEMGHLIYNWSPRFTGSQGSDFTQEYQWPVPQDKRAALFNTPPGPVFRV